MGSQHGSILPYTSGLSWWQWCNVWERFSWHTTSQALFKHYILSVVAGHVNPFLTTVFLSVDGYFQQDNAPCCLNVTISLLHSNGFHSHHASLLGCDKDSYRGCTADMHLQAVDQHNLMMPSSVRNVFSTLLTLYHKQSHPIKP